MKIIGLYAVILTFLTAFFILPVAIAVRGAFVDQTGSLTFAYLEEVFRNPIYLEGFLNTLKIAVGSTLAAFVLASTHVLIPITDNMLGRSSGYTVEDFHLVARITADPLLLVTNPAVPAKNTDMSMSASVATIQALSSGTPRP